MSQKLQKLQSLGRKIVEFHQEVYQELEDLRAETAKELDLRVLADTAYFLREVDKHLKELGKTARDVQGYAEKLACVIAVHRHLEGEVIRTDYCSASPRAKITVPLPHHRRNPDEFKALMKWLKVPEEHWNCEEPTINLRWDGIVEAITSAAEEGRPLPEGFQLDKKYTQYSLRIVRKRDITEDVPTENGDVF